MYSGSWFAKERPITVGKAADGGRGFLTSGQAREQRRELTSKTRLETIKAHPDDPLPPPKGPTASPNSITSGGQHVHT